MKVNENCQVTINYQIRTLDGKVIDRSLPGEPISFTTGRGEVVEVLELALMGMEPGGRKNFQTRPDEAYGPRDAEAVRRVPKAEINNPDALKEGMMFRVQDDDGGRMVVTVSKIEDDEVLFDLNHPLAGTPLDFEVEIADVGDPAPASECGCGCGCSGSCDDDCDDEGCGGGCG
jgi:FKBP-type peptidyl-prolyl cis-trans isomerase SlyD